jgi:hypothetical protein
VHKATQRAYEVSRERWIDDPGMLDEIIRQMQVAEAASADVMQFIDAMVEERHKNV